MHALLRSARLVVLVFSLLLATAASAPARETVLLTTGEWPPFFSSTLPHGGVANHVIEESFKLVGMDVDFEFLPWIRAMQTARYGPAVGSAGWLRQSERERHFLYSEPIFSSRRVFFHLRQRKFDWRTLDDIKDLRVAVTLGSADEFPFDDVLASGRGKVDIAKSYAAGMRKLAAGRVDIYACNLDVGLFVLVNQVPQAEADIITYHPRSIFEETNHLIISKRLPDAEQLMARFNKGLRMLKASGRHESILSDPSGWQPLGRVLFPGVSH